MNGGKEKEVSMKEWILRYAEQQSDEEKNESVKESDEEKFDPVRQNNTLWKSFKNWYVW